MLLANNEYEAHDNNLGEWFENIGKGDFAKNLENTADTVNKVGNSSKRIAGTISNIFGGGSDGGSGSNVPAVTVTPTQPSRAGSPLLYTSVGLGVLAFAGTAYFIFQQN